MRVIIRHTSPSRSSHAAPVVVRRRRGVSRPRRARCSVTARMSRWISGANTGCTRCSTKAPWGEATAKVSLIRPRPRGSTQPGSTSKAGTMAAACSTVTGARLTGRGCGKGGARGKGAGPAGGPLLSFAPGRIIVPALGDEVKKQDSGLPEGPGRESAIGCRCASSEVGLRSPAPRLRLDRLAPSRELRASRIAPRRELTRPTGGYRPAAARLASTRSTIGAQRGSSCSETRSGSARRCAASRSPAAAARSRRSRAPGRSPIRAWQHAAS